MTWVAVAVGGASLLSGMMNADAASSAAENQASAARAAGNLQMNQYYQNRSDLAPYRNTGYAALAQLSNLMGLGNVGGTSATDNSYYLNNAPSSWNTSNSFLGGINRAQEWGKLPEADRLKAWGVTGSSTGTPTNPAETGLLNRQFSMKDFQVDPGYQYRVDQANKALERSAAARGNLLSGGTTKGIAELNQNLASQEYQNAYNRFNTAQSERYNRLASLAGIGQTATNSTNQMGSNAAALAGDYGTQSANANAAGTLGSTAALTSGLQGGLNAYQNYNNWNTLMGSNTGYSNTNPWGGQLYGSANGGTQYVD